MFSIFTSCTNYVKTVIPEPKPYNDFFENVQPISKAENSHLPYKKYSTRCTLGCIKPTRSSTTPSIN